MGDRSTYQNFIGGEWTESNSGETFENRNPACRDEIIGDFQRSDKSDVYEAVEAASKAFPEWAKTSASKRGKLLRRAAESIEKRKGELIETLSREEGKTLKEAAGEVKRSRDIFYYYAEKAKEIGGELRSPNHEDKELYTKQEPLGVAAILTPWNYPSAIPSWKMAPALAAGNCVVIKPASLAPYSCLKIVECLEKAGLPEGTVNLITGPGKAVGKALVVHEDVDAVSFTGSLEVGDRVRELASRGGKRVQTEMGGKNPLLVMESADVNEAVEIAVSGAFGVTGQACTATSRAIVHEKLYDEFLEKMRSKVESMEVGPGLENPDMGPQVSRGELWSTLDYIESGKQEGAELLIGGERADVESDGHFVQPTVFSETEPDMKIAQEEIFGPVLSVMKTGNYEEAVEIANGIDYGLSASIITQDLSEAHRFIQDSESGVVKVNEKTTGLELHVPFGGMKASSSETWREQGEAGLDFYTISKTVYLNY